MNYNRITKLGQTVPGGGIRPIGWVLASEIEAAAIDQLRDVFRQLEIAAGI